MIHNNEFYQVANIGLRPHNLEPEKVLALLDEANNQEHTLLTLKPGYYPDHPKSGMPVQRYLEGMVTAAGLEVVCTGESMLDGQEVCELYRDVLPPNEEDDKQFGTGWKHELITYMTSGKLFTYLIRGDDAFYRTRTVKNFVRKLHIVDDISKVVENVGHVPDPEDFDISLQILLLGGMALDHQTDNPRLKQA